MSSRLHDELRARVELRKAEFNKLATEVLARRKATLPTDLAEQRPATTAHASAR